ncbi:MAG: nucleotidyltransferase family protein [Candidatus Electrothrix sp. YB6]
MKILHPLSLEELRKHEQNCETSVVLGSHEMDRHAPTDAFKLYKAMLEPEDTDSVYLLDCDFVPWTEGYTGRLRDFDQKKADDSTRKRIESFITHSEQSGKQPVDLRSSPQLALTLICAQPDGPWVIIDGNHRALAQYRQYGSLADVPAYVCVHPEIGDWRYIPNFMRTALHSQEKTVSCSAAQQAAEPDADNMHGIGITRQILSLCARIEPHQLQQELLVKACAGFSGWDDLLEQAEAHGMAPLLHRHCTAAGIALPDNFLRRLRLLCLRHRQTNLLLTKALGRILALLESEGFPVLVLKGAALCHTQYPEPGLRPMRDIDLLLPWKDALPAHALLQKHGFLDPGTPTAADHLHLAELYQEMDGIRICLELHRNLYPDCPPYSEKVDFDMLYRNAASFDADGVTAYTLADEEMLWHLYQHGFHAPLTYDPYKLISAADIVSLIESRLETIDWDRIKSVYPHLLRALPHLHYLTPWSETVCRRLSLRNEPEPKKVGASFTGWPRRKLGEQKGRGMLPILRDTFLPPDWWLRIYYAPTGRLGRLRALLAEHPKHIFWWIKLYWDIFLQANLPLEVSQELKKRQSRLTLLRNWKTLAAALYRKIR